VRIGITAELLSNIPLTGVELYTYNLIKELLESKKHNFTLICAPNTPRKLVPGSAEIVVHKPFRLFGTKFFSYLVMPPKCLNEFDLIHCPTVAAPFFFRPRGKVVMTVHDLTPVINPKWHILRRRLYFKCILKYRFKYVDMFIATSQNTKKDLIDRFNISPEKIEVIYEGVSDRFKPGKQKKQNFVLAVSTLEPRKNFVRIIQSYINLREKFSAAEDLIIVGKKGWHFKEILNIPPEYESHIDFTGYVSENKLIELYQTAKIFVYPSLYEGFGLPVLEAMACGCPVITSNVSSLPEVAGDAAILVDPYNTDALTDAMHKVLTNENLRERLAVMGLERAKKFSWERCARETLNVFNTLGNA